METDYHKIGVSVADTIAKIDEPLTMDQRMFLVGALSPWLKQRDDRIAELEKALRTYFTLSEELCRLIDDDKDVRALKLSLAMAGHRPKYRSDVDEARSALMGS